MNAASPEMKPPAQEEEDPRYKKAPYSMFLSPNYNSINPLPTPNYYRPTGYAEGGIAALAPGGIAGTEPNMYPQSQMDKTQYSTPTQMPTSAEIIASGYEPKVNPYTGEPQQMAMASGGIASYSGKDGSEVEDEDRFNVETPDRERKTRFTVMPHMVDLDRKLMAGRVGADIPMGKDTLSAGLSGIAGNMGGHFGAKPMAVDVGYNTKVGPGYLNAQIARDLANRQNRYQANYNIPFAEGGQLGGYSDGGRMLKGPGDGMSDSIPATIGGKQPARLADGEFVVPADVVSHLGNGSTDAGAKKLYSMMDKIRKARTGKKKQAPEVKADKFMPA